MVVDGDARAALRRAVVRFMKGEIRSSSFDEENSRYSSARLTSDESVHKISRSLWYFHDDIVDHAISVTPEGWETLRRVVAFLGTNRELGDGVNRATWPFPDEETWRAHEASLDEYALPAYDPAIHCRQIHPWWDRIPSWIGFLLLGLSIVVTLILAQWLL